MKKEKKLKIFLVDDDPLYLKSLEIDFIQAGNYDFEMFTTGELCIENLYKKPDIVVLDYHLDSINKQARNGIETLDVIKRFDPKIPVIILSSQDKIDVAVSCMHHHAIDYVVKSETAFLRLQKIMHNIFNYQKMEKELNWYMERM